MTSTCPNCGRPVYAGGRPDARQWCECDTFAELDHPDDLTVPNGSAPLSLF